MYVYGHLLVFLVTWNKSGHVLLVLGVAVYPSYHDMYGYYVLIVLSVTWNKGDHILLAIGVAGYPSYHSVYGHCFNCTFGHL